MFVRISDKCSRYRFDSRRLRTPFISIPLPVPGASQIDSRWLPSTNSTSIFKKACILRLDGHCTSVLVEIIYKFISNKEMPLFAIIFRPNEPNPFLCHPAVLDEFRKHLILLLSVGIIKYVNNIALTSFSRHDDARVQR